ncbi:glutathione peroxidase [Paenibacillus sp. tmac-D7]|uniref:glutathione peroxidase n=1 Tax=Paenibacillus sp. tmac-D7 TaxID=2591462 RepID=UPI001141CD5A|nr:glutathione peroxidase [Paenibacillus sp. tmac-D7]
MSVYEFKANNIRGEQVSLEAYKGKVLVIVNTASKCGLTPQYNELQQLYETYKDRGLNILGFPCNQFGAQEPGSNEEINTFCTLNYGVTFPLFDKVEVRGENKHPLFAYLTEQAPFEGIDPQTGGKLASFLEQQGLLEGNEIKWNFTKFLIDRSGNVVKRFEPPVTPAALTADIEALL